MELTRSFDEYRPWSGAISTYEKIEDAGKLEELEQLMEEWYPEGAMSETQLNDILCFDSETILEQLGITEEEEEEEEEELDNIPEELEEAIKDVVVD